jgi:hypothetical protein
MQLLLSVKKNFVIALWVPVGHIFERMWLPMMRRIGAGIELKN